MQSHIHDVKQYEFTKINVVDTKQESVDRMADVFHFPWKSKVTMDIHYCYKTRLYYAQTFIHVLYSEKKYCIMFASYAKR